MDLKSLLCIDLECTCWDEPSSLKNMEKREIIEIGVAIIHLKDEVVIERGKKIYVKPQNTEVSEYCTNLTGITQHIVDTQGIALQDACKMIEESYGSKARPWVSWGRFDRDQLIRECRNKNIQYPMSAEYFNMSILYSLISKRKRKSGMRRAMNELDIKFEGTPHSGSDDSFNLAKVVQSLFW